MLSDAARIAWFDLKLMLRQKETLLWTFLMPGVFFYFIGTVTGGFGGGGGGAPDTLAVRVEEDAGFLADSVLERLAEQDFRLVYPDRETEPEAPAFDAYDQRLTIPAGFTRGLLAGDVQELRVQQNERGLRASYAAFQINRAAYTTLADAIAACNPEGGDALDPTALTAEHVAALRAMPRALTLEVKQAGQRKRIPNGFEQAVPGTMVMFAMIILLTSGASTLIVERREGLLRRLASAPIRRGAVVLGKWGGRVALGAVQLAFAMVLGSVAFGVSWGPQAWMLAFVLLAYAGLLASISILVGNAAKTEGQAIGLSVLATNVLAALGGCWWPIEITPEFMQRIALFLPTGWAMDAIHKLVSFGAPAASVLPHLIGMALGALALGMLAARRLRFV